MKYFYSENAALERKVDFFFAVLSEVNEKKYKNALSILLLGSLSRGEATWRQTEDGHTQMLSDIEFFTIYPDGFSQFSMFDADLKHASEEVFGTNNLSLFHIDNTYVNKSTLHRMERKLLIYDAKVFGKCVVGEDILGLIPEVTVKNINWCDIWDIMTHRVFSVLYYGFPFKRQGMENEYRYSLAKNSLDLMTVILVANKRLESGFERRLTVLKELDIPPRWIDYFTYCLNTKLGKKSEKEYTLGEMERLFGEILTSLERTFHVPISNMIVNAKSVFRRRIGMMKRAIQSRHLPPLCHSHLRNLMEDYEKGMELNAHDMKNNYVLHGYPKKGI
jgi:hypothetical protein